jgi:hypothetical protein
VEASATWAWVRRVRVPLHPVERLVDPHGHLVALEQRLGVHPERGDEELLSCVLTRNRVVVPEGKELCEPCRQPLADSFRGADDPFEVAVLEPQVAQRVLVEVVGQRLARKMPLMPPADEPAMASTTTRVWTLRSARNALSSSR